jgi:hypothetical protein
MLIRNQILFLLDAREKREKVFMQQVKCFTHAAKETKEFSSYFLMRDEACALDVQLKTNRRIYSADSPGSDVLVNGRNVYKTANSSRPKFLSWQTKNTY